MGGGSDSKPVPIKKEAHVFIKSEFPPSLASLPMAPTSAVKQELTAVKKEPSAVKREFVEDKKPAFSNIPGRRDRGARSGRRRGFGSSLVHRVDGFHVRAHYGNGKVDFTITKDGPKTRDLDWREVEREMFRKLHRVHFYIEPTERPGLVTGTFTRMGPEYTKLRFSVHVRNVQPHTLPAATTYGSDHGTQLLMNQNDVEDDEGKVGLGLDSSSGTRAGRPNLEFPEASLPARLPEVTSCHMYNGGNEMYFQDIQQGAFHYRPG